MTYGFMIAKQWRKLSELRLFKIENRRYYPNNKGSKNTVSNGRAPLELEVTCNCNRSPLTPS